MNSCLIIPAPIRSHVIPSFYLASILSQRYQVTYASLSGELDELVKANGFESIQLQAERFGLGFDPVYNWSRYGQRLSMRFLIHAIFDGLRMKVYKERKKEIEKIISKLNPELVIIDIFSSTDFLIIKPLFPDIKIAFFNPMLNTYELEGFPNVRGHIDDIRKRRENFLDILKQKTSPMRLIAKLVGYDASWQISLLYKKYPILKNFPMDIENKVIRIFKNIPELILAPQEMEYSAKIIKKNQLYLGLCQKLDRKDTLLDDSYFLQIEKIISIKKNKGIPLIYCSFGSYFSSLDEHKYIIAFCLYLIKAFQEDSIIFVVSVKKEIVEAILRYTNIPVNFHFFFRVPQLKILESADLFITHGGLGSVKEAIQKQVPMLVYPLDLSWDQKGNAHKIEYHGLGISGDFKKDGLLEIKEKIIRLLSDEYFRHNIKKFYDSCTSLDNYSENTDKLFHLINIV